MDSIKLIKDLTNANGISRFERPVLEVAKTYLNDSLTSEIDRINNMKITKKDEDANKPKIFLDGHPDELGLMVQAITKRGLIKVANIGGWEPKNLLAQKFRMYNKKGECIKGIVATVPVHFLNDAMRNHVTKIEDLTVDVGANSYDEAIALGIYIGMPMTPDVEFEYFDRNGGVMMAKALDNRLGCALVVDVMNSNYSRDKYEISGFLAAQEEVGARGAEVISNTQTGAEVAIVFEGTPSDDGHVALDEAQAVCGGGVQIRIKDAQMISDPAIYELAIELAKENNIPYQVLVRAGGSTNGKMYQAKGVPCLVLSVPVRFAHSHYGISKYSDYKATLDLALKFIEHINKFGLPENK